MARDRHSHLGQGQRPTNPLLPPYVGVLRSDVPLDGRPAFMHLGHWDEPSGESFAHGLIDAQHRLNDIILGIAEVKDGSRVLDIGCGFGGTAQVLDLRHANTHVIGVDVDEAQLSICRQVCSASSNRLTWAYADSQALPIRACTVDSLVSIEAAFHFRSRAQFYSEAARVLRPGGHLAAVDILVDRSRLQHAGISIDLVRRQLVSTFGPWPEIETSLDQVLGAATTSGFRSTVTIDATQNTLPTYYPHHDSGSRPGAEELSGHESVQRFVDLHRQGILRVFYLGFIREQT